MIWEEIESEIIGKMESRGIDPDTVNGFLLMVRAVRDSAAAPVPLHSVLVPDPCLLLNPPTDPAELSALDRRGRDLLSRVAVVKLNGGRSTTMDGRVPKGVLPAKDGHSYLEIIIRQIEILGKKHGVDIPLVLMNSFFTHEPTREIIGRFDMPVLTFVQNQVPRLLSDSLLPLETGTDEDWAPPGHGDVYESLCRSGMLELLRSRGCRWAFISNLDNLCASVEPWLVGLLERDGIEFLLEVTDRTVVDRKGGTLIVRDGHLDLLEIAQVKPEERGLFMDLNLFRVFNTNNVWIDLEALAQTLSTRRMRLPVIQNRKTIARRQVIQLECAMGAAIGVFSAAKGLRVGRDRFFPTKGVQDLFVLQSDACILDADFHVRVSPKRPDTLPLRPRVTFSEGFLDTPLRMSERFEDPASVSLLEAESLEVSGNAFFGRDVTIKGNVVIEAPHGEEHRIPPGTVLKDGIYP